MSSTTEYALCDICKSISIETLSSPAGQKHPGDTSSPAERSCSLCGAFSREQKIWPESPQNPQNLRLFLMPKEGTKFRSLGIALESGDSSKTISYPIFTDESEISLNARRLQTNLQRDDPAVLSGVRIKRKPEPPSSHTAYEIGKSWLEDCLSHHNCGKYSSSTGAKLPARLIDLEVFSAGSEDARLIAVENSDLNFATLSYCWGDAMPEGSATILSNIGKRQERIYASELPQTLRDACKVTRALGIRYLWVDALCIIQDCPEDWETESAKMADIYGNGLISIAVELRSNCADGFLGIRPKEENVCVNHMIKIPNTLTTGEKSCLYVWVREICRCFIRDDIDHLSKTALSKRGWTYQERFLAPRILHFVGAQIIWECRECHGLPLESGGSLRDNEVLHKIPPIFGPIAKYIFHEEAEVTNLIKYWYEDVVPEYCRRKLSQSSDKLPAISGIANAFQRKLRHTYFTGLWLEDIAYGLSWSTRYAAEYPDTYRAPTFAWISVDGPVHWPRGPSEGLTHYVQLECYHFDLTGADFFGRVSGGWIKINGFLGKGTVKSRKLVCDNSDVILGYPYLDADRRMGIMEGMSVTYLVLSTAPPGSFNSCRLLILRQKGDVELEFERIGFAISADMDVHLNEAWFSRHCVRTSLKIF